MADQLNTAQQQAVKHKDGPLMVVAGAGTGKTRVITERIAALIDGGVQPRNILALTFTEKAAQEMLDRVNDLRGSYTLDVTIATYNGFGNDLLKEFATEIGLSSSLRLLGDTGQLVFMREHLDELELDYFAPISKPDSQLENIAQYISQLKQQLVTPERYAQFAQKMTENDEESRLEKQKHTELARAYSVYVRLCRQRHVIDYDDQLYLANELLEKRPNILKQLRDRYKYIMVDEFQDTNPMQSALIDKFAAAHSNIMVVGDDDQSIYGWRGATLTNILEFTHKYTKTKQITLTENYRSTQDVLDAAYRLIKFNNPNRLEYMNKLDKRLTSNTGKGEQPQIRQFDHIDSELRWIAGDITRRITNGQKPGSIAILTRRNQIIQRVHEALDMANIQHVVAGLSSDLYKQLAVTHLIEILKAINDPQDAGALYHVLSGPAFNVTPTVLANAASQAKKHHQPLHEALYDDQTTQKALQQLEAWRLSSPSQSVGQIAYSVISDTGWKNQLVQAAADDDNVATQIQALGQFFNTLKEFENIADVPSIRQYIEDLPTLRAAGSALQTDDSMDISNATVNVLSVHKAKGLEWQTVYVVDCTEGSFPMRARNSSMSVPEKLTVTSDADDHIAEERRLMYVAATRAKQELVLTFSDTHTGKTRKRPSRFIAELMGNNFDTIRHVQDESTSAALESFAATSPDGHAKLPSSMVNGEKLVLSVSQVDCYLRCPQDFYYRYVLQVPQPENPALGYGTLVHTFIQRVHESMNRGEATEFEALMEQLEDMWPKAGYHSAKQRERAQAAGKEALGDLYERLITSDTPMDIEESFHASIPGTSLILRGRIDAVYKTEKGIEIRDYKTGTGVDSADKAKKRAQASQQLSLYALAWRTMYGGEMPALLSLDFVETGHTGSVKKQSKTLDNLEIKLAEMVKNIQSGLFKPSQDHTYCSHPQRSV